MTMQPDEDNPDCPNCGNPRTTVHNQFIKTFSYYCEECDAKFTSEDVQA